MSRTDGAILQVFPDDGFGRQRRRRIGGIMRSSASLRYATVLVATLLLAGCGHKLIATADEHTVKVYPDRDTLQKLTDLKRGGGIGGMIGNLGSSMTAKEVNDKTPVKVISSDDA